jgi:hypothetical protein
MKIILIWVLKTLFGEGMEGGRWGVSTYVYTVFACAGAKGNGVGYFVIGGALVKFYKVRTSASPVVKYCVPALYA